MYCGIDIGTSSIKCMFVAENGQRLGFGRANVGLYKGNTNWEADPIEWLKATALAVDQAMSLIKTRQNKVKTELRAIAISGNGPTLVPVQKDGLPYGRAISWMDRSATKEAKLISDIANRTVDPSFYLPKVLRIINSKEAKNVAKFFSGPEYLAFLLGAKPISYLQDDYYDAYIWDKALLSKLNINEELFPPYVAPGTIIGKVSPSAALAVGLPEGTAIVSAFPDFLAALVGSGTVKEGMACDRTGSSEAINICAKNPYPGPEILSLPHAIKNFWNLSGGVSTSGRAAEWLSKIFSYSGSINDNIYKDAEEAIPSSNGLLFIPYLAGERAPLWNANLRGSFVGLNLDHGKAEMSRALLEGICFGLRYALEKIEEKEIIVNIIRASGAASGNNFLSQLKSTILNKQVEVPLFVQCETMGDAAICATALGDYSNLAEAATNLVHLGRTFMPNSSLTKLYNDNYHRWKNHLNYLLNN